jgi:hypothetical protein
VFCKLIQLESGRWYCPACDPQAERTLPLGTARRHCGPPTPPAILAARALAAELRQAAAHGDLGLPLEQVEARLAVCSGCGDFRGAGCGRFAARYAACRAWFWALVGNRRQPLEPCERWPASNPTHHAPRDEYAGE